jgi:hypothetical protein
MPSSMIQTRYNVAFLLIVSSLQDIIDHTKMRLMHQGHGLSTDP